jgi:hypothetical protein
MQAEPVYSLAFWLLIFGGLVCVSAIVGLVVVVALASQKRGRRD